MICLKQRILSGVSATRLLDCRRTAMSACNPTHTRTLGGGSRYAAIWAGAGRCPIWSPYGFCGTIFFVYWEKCSLLSLSVLQDMSASVSVFVLQVDCWTCYCHIVGCYCYSQCTVRAFI